VSEYFIQKIFIKDVRGIIRDLEIPLSETERKHLIITGKNGSGKTSLLNEIDSLLNKLLDERFIDLLNKIKLYESHIEFYEQAINGVESESNDIKTMMSRELSEWWENKLEAERNYNNFYHKFKNLENEFNNSSKVDLIFSNQSDIYENIVNGQFILTFFRAKRDNSPTIPQTPTKQNFKQKYSTTQELNKTFLQYLLNLKTSQAFAQIENNIEEVKKIKKWFERFEKALKDIFDKPDLKITFNSKNYDFKIDYDGKSFGLDELSDGYSSLLAIVTELILRMEAHNVKAYDMQGVILVDEIETHLHVELQKKVLPFLVSFFPKIQFIVTTHSPFVLQSIENAVICDLEKRFITSDLSNYSYDALIESYFDSDKYSQEIKDKLYEFEELSKKVNRTDNERDKLQELKRFFMDLPKFKADELAVKVNDILLNNLGK
jgi:predicted ATP-binding protein involved in virulence